MYNISIPKETLLDYMEFMSSRSLVRARARTDCAAMLLHRRRWQNIKVREDVSVYIFCGASLQWRGTELFATTFDVIVGWELVCRLAPLVALNKTQLDLKGKLAALLQQTYSVIGALNSLKRFCRRVQSVTTGMGTERLVADRGSCMKSFFASAFLREKTPESVGSEHLFEGAVHMPGIRHLVDSVIQRGLCSLHRFPGYWAKLKCIARFLRSDLNLAEISRCLERDGFGSGCPQSLDPLIGCLALGGATGSNASTQHLFGLSHRPIRPEGVRRREGNDGCQSGIGSVSLAILAQDVWAHDLTSFLTASTRSSHVERTAPRLTAVSARCRPCVELCSSPPARHKLGEGRGGVSSSATRVPRRIPRCYFS